MESHIHIMNMALELVKEVIIPCLDPNVKVNGKGAEALRNAGIEV